MATPPEAPRYETLDGCQVVPRLKVNSRTPAVRLSSTEVIDRFDWKLFQDGELVEEAHRVTSGITDGTCIRFAPTVPLRRGPAKDIKVPEGFFYPPFGPRFVFKTKTYVGHSNFSVDFNHGAAGANEGMWVLAAAPGTVLIRDFRAPGTNGPEDEGISDVLIGHPGGFRTLYTYGPPLRVNRWASTSQLRRTTASWAATRTVCRPSWRTSRRSVPGCGCSTWGAAPAHSSVSWSPGSDLTGSPRSTRPSRSCRPHAQRHPRVDVRLAAAERLPFPDATFDVALAQLVVHFMTDPVGGLGEMARVTRVGGVVAACVWDHASDHGPLGVFWRAARELDPAVLDESDLPGVHEGHLADLLEATGVCDSIEEATLVVRVEHPTFQEWWEPFTRGVGPAGAYVAGLDDRRREALRARCHAALPSEPFTVTARAWAARGVSQSARQLSSRRPSPELARGLPPMMPFRAHRPRATREVEVSSRPLNAARSVLLRPAVQALAKDQRGWRLTAPRWPPPRPSRHRPRARTRGP